jgi:hypothetical protein
MEPFTFVFSEQVLRNNVGFKQFWDFDIQIDALSPTRRGGRYGIVMISITQNLQ